MWVAVAVGVAVWVGGAGVLVGVEPGAEVLLGSGVFVAVFGTPVEVGVAVTTGVVVADWPVAVEPGVLVAVEPVSVVGVAVSSGAGLGPAVSVTVAVASAVSVGGAASLVGVEVGVLKAGGMLGSSTTATGVRASS